MSKTRKTATKKATAPRQLTNDAEVQIDRIASERGTVGNAAQNFYYTIYYAPPFLTRVTLDTLAQAAAKLNLPPFTDEGDEAEQFTRLVNLFEATSDDFTLDRTPESIKQKARDMIAALESPLDGEDSPRMKAAREYGDMLRAAIKRGRVLDPSYVRRMLPVVLEINQEMAEIDAYWRRSEAARRGAQTRKTNKAKGGAK